MSARSDGRGPLDYRLAAEDTCGRNKYRITLRAGVAAMAMENWDPNEIPRLRLAIERIQKDILEVNGRLGELEQIAVQRLSAAPQIEQPGGPPPLPTSKLTSDAPYHPAAAAASKIDEVAVRRL